MVCSLPLKDSRSNYEPDSNLLGNAETSGMSLSGKGWLEHHHVCKNMEIIEFFWAPVPSMDSLIFHNLTHSGQEDQGTVSSEHTTPRCVIMISSCQLMKNLIFL